MMLRIALFLSMAFGIIGIGGVVWLANSAKPAQIVVAAPAAPLPMAAPPPPARQAILVAGKPLRAGNLLKPEDISQQEMPLGDVPLNAVVATRASRSDMVGAMLRRSLQPNEPMLSSDVMMPGDHGFLAAVLAPGMRAATVAVDAVSGSAGLIWPGDQVDVVLTQAIEDQKVPAGHRLAAERVLENLRVVAVDQQLVRGAQPGAENQAAARTITLEATPEQAEKIAVAMRIGKVQLVVRSASEPAVAAPAVPTPAGPGAPAPVVAARPPVRGPTVSSTVWASDVSKAIGGDGSGAGMVRVFSGATDAKEYHFQ